MSLDLSTRLSASQIAGGTIVVSLLVLALKLGAWALTDSVALFSDAMESLVNVSAAVLAWFAIRYAERPADDGHPFGHHKAEYFSAVIEGIMIILAAALIVHQAISALTSGAMANLTPVALVVNAAALAINLLWAQILLRSGLRLKSPAFEAGGRHLMSDVWTSAGVMGGLILVLVTGWTVLDPILALLVAVNILREGLHVVSDSVDGLMDKAASDEEQDKIRAVILGSGGGALQIHDIKTRRAGKAIFVEFHMVVDGAMTVAQSHDICDRLEHEIEATLPGVHVTIHVEPDHKLEDSGLEPTPPAPR
ncbi:cation diffusion facilitator family transporter [Tritonibacter scottomollicae]|uniref:Protein p34 n=1 Tax=Tritonibacter scottomollicae TaxID=483013 RepID=A0A2T1AEL4_TRISK|nr:cation diffusion facilitator family transporter [Tritonibacter scottomollicae]PRZ47025.1 cation diffusion facilitator family transporter [Tritonibacter scottomollicae]